jgi:hypothetical protein
MCPAGDLVRVSIIPDSHQLELYGREIVPTAADSHGPYIYSILYNGVAHARCAWLQLHDKMPKITVLLRLFFPFSRKQSLNSSHMLHHHPSCTTHCSLSLSLSKPHLSLLLFSIVQRKDDIVVVCVLGQAVRSIAISTLQMYVCTYVRSAIVDYL